MDIELQKDIHDNAKRHGWYETKRSLKELRVLINSELMEAFECWRNGKIKTKFNYKKFLTYRENKGLVNIDIKESPFNSMQDYNLDIILGKPVGLGSELADVEIRGYDAREYFNYRFAFSCRTDEEIENPQDYFDSIVWALYRTNLEEYEDIDYFMVDLEKVFAMINNLANYFNIDLRKEVLQKHEYNKTRSYRHGGKVC